MSTFERYQDFISDPQGSLYGNPMSHKLLVSTDGRFQTFYAPFDHINLEAKVVICGITPGKQQAMNALEEARKSLVNGDSAEVAIQKAKKFGSFSGGMRPNLVAMLNYIGLDEVLGITNCTDLFGAHSNLVHYTSALRNPVFRDGNDYSGSPSMVKQPAMLKQIEETLVEEIRMLNKDCLYIPLGEEVSKVFTHLEAKGLINPGQVLKGLPHPSKKSIERVLYFLGKKDRDALSNRTDPDKIDASKAAIALKIRALRSR